MVIARSVTNYNERQNIAKLKKAYSTIQNALNLAIAENGTVNNWSAYTSNGADGTTDDLANILVKYLNVAEIINIYNLQSRYVDLNKEATQVRYVNRPLYYGKKYTLRDGTTFAIVAFADSNSSRYWCKEQDGIMWAFCGFINVDLNGYKKGPNRYGDDTFGFYLYQNKIIPMGMPGSKTNYAGTFNNSCKANTLTNGTFGLACTAWVLMNDNMDYLHCPEELSFSGKTSCR